jgi:hypothetical protein
MLAYSLQNAFVKNALHQFKKKIISMSLLLKFYYFILLLFIYKNSAGNKRIYEKDILCLPNPYVSNKIVFGWVGWEL